jgi:hypothetical protein
MKWLDQLAQVTILVLFMGGFLAYVMETDGPSSPDWAPPLDLCVELRDPNHMCMPTVELAMQRQRELGPPRSCATNDSGTGPDAREATTQREPMP